MPFDIAESFVIAAERLLGAPLPSSYRNSMLRANGGEVEISGGIWQLHPVADSSDRKRLSRSANHIPRETEVCRGWDGFPDEAIAIAINGAGDRLVLVRRGRFFDPSIHLWRHGTDELIQVADEFPEAGANRPGPRRRAGI